MLRDSTSYPPDAIKASLRAQLSLALAGTDRSVSLGWLDTLPNASSSTLYDCGRGQMQTACARTLVAETLMQAGRIDDAITAAQSELGTPHNYNLPSRARAGRVLGRCHAAKGEPALSYSAFDAAIELAKSGRLHRAEALTVRARVAAGREGGGTGAPHWDERTGRQRIAEVAGRAQGDRAQLEAALLSA